jgi:redox-sensitive bicupin YhaK (pirin superfamily)
MPEGISGVAYLYNGELDYHGQMIASGQLLITSDGDSLSVQAGSNGAELLVICGHPLAEPVVGYGPFVMSSQEEIEVALSDYQRGELIKHPVQS